MEREEKKLMDLDCNIEQILLENGMIDDLFFLEDLKQRKLFLNGDIEPMSVDGIVRNIMQINTEDKGIKPEDRKPILLYLNSDGGEIDSGFKLIDTIESSITPVYTINNGYQYSMGFLIGLSGHVRYATKNAKFLMHDGSVLEYGSGAKVKDRMKFQNKVDERIKNQVLTHSKLTSKEYDNKFRVEWYMFAEEAKEYGFTDFIIGVDCDIDEII